MGQLDQLYLGAQFLLGDFYCSDLVYLVELF